MSKIQGCAGIACSCGINNCRFRTHQKFPSDCSAGDCGSSCGDANVHRIRSIDVPEEICYAPLICATSGDRLLHTACDICAIFSYQTKSNIRLHRVEIDDIEFRLGGDQRKDQISTRWRRPCTVSKRCKIATDPKSLQPRSGARYLNPTWNGEKRITCGFSDEVSINAGKQFRSELGKLSLRGDQPRCLPQDL